MDKTKRPKHDEPTILERKDMYAFIGRLTPTVDVGDHKTSLRSVELMGKHDYVLEHFECAGDRDWPGMIARMQQSVTRYWEYTFDIWLLVDSVKISVGAPVTVNGCTGRAFYPQQNETPVLLSLVFTVCPVFYFPEDLTDAASDRNVTLVARIVESGVNVNSGVPYRHATQEHCSALDIAAINDDPNMISYLLRCPSIDLVAPSSDGSSFLQRNIRRLRTPILSMIVSRGVDLHTRNIRGENIVHTMMKAPYDESDMKIILAAGSETLTLCVDAAGKTPLDLLDNDSTHAMVSMMRTTSARAFRAVTEITLSLIPVLDIVYLVMGYYTKHAFPYIS